MSHGPLVISYQCVLFSSSVSVVIGLRTQSGMTLSVPLLSIYSYPSRVIMQPPYIRFS